VARQCRICEMGRRNLKLLVDLQAARDPTFPADTFNFVLEHLEHSIRDAQGLVEHYADGEGRGSGIVALPVL